jgi:hypothetical protein
MAVPAGSTLVSTAYEKAHWVGQTLISLYGDRPELRCARVIGEYRVQDPRTVVDAAFAAAGPGGSSGPPPGPDGTEAVFEQGRSRIRIGWSSAAVRAPYGYARVTVVISDLPAPYGGDCQGDRLGIYPTHIQY